MKTKFLFFAFAFTTVFASCIKDEIEQTVISYSSSEYATLQKALKLPPDLHNYSLTLPNHLGGFPVAANNHQATLGRVLFYDKNLSSTGQVACASCHKAEFSFGDNEAFSRGVTTERTSRNSIALGSFPSFGDHYNGFGGGSRLFWDERAGSVSEQSKQSFLNPVEMGVKNLSDLAEKVRQQDYYDILFKKAFPPGEVFMSKEEQILFALQAFVNSFGFFETKYDQQLMAGQNEFSDFNGFTQEENLGKTLFKIHCETCHNLGPSFATKVNVANNGLDATTTDPGVGGITQMPSDMGVFKVPLLRNVALSAPFMHDGRFATLEQVIDHYSTGIKNHPNLHENLKAGTQPKRMNFTSAEKAALVAFLHTLTDQSSLAQERFSNPFK